MCVKCPREPAERDSQEALSCTKPVSVTCQLPGGHQASGVWAQKVPSGSVLEHRPCWSPSLSAPQQWPPCPPPGAALAPLSPGVGLLPPWACSASWALETGQATGPAVALGPDVACEPRAGCLHHPVLGPVPLARVPSESPLQPVLGMEL